MRNVFALLVGGMLMSGNAHAINKCPGPDGRPVFQDTPCVGGQELDVKPASGVKGEAPAPKPRQSTVTRDPREVERAKQAAENQREIDRSEARIKKLRQENADPQKCQQAKHDASVIERRDPLLAKSNPDYFMAQQKISLYCGAGQPLTPSP